MKTLLRALPAIVLLCGAGVGEAEAQLGAIIDKIQKLSGPEIRYYGAMVRTGYQPGQRLDAQRLNVLQSRSDRTDRRGDECVQEVIAYSRTALADGYLDERAVDQLREDLARVSELREDIQGQRMGAYVGALCREQIRPLLTSARQDPMRGIVWRFGFFAGHADDPDDDAGLPVGEVLSVMTKASVEYRHHIDLTIDVGVEAGLNAMYFYGDIDRPFLHPTFPIQFNIHPFSRWESWLLRNVRAGVGVLAVPPFPDNAFAPIGAYEVDEDDWEFVAPNWTLAIDISLGSGAASPLRR